MNRVAATSYLQSIMPSSAYATSKTCVQKARRRSLTLAQRLRLKIFLLTPLANNDRSRTV